MANIVRSSKYRHIFGQPQKESFTAITVSKDSADCSFCAVNPKFLSFINDKGRIYVIPHEKVGRQPTDLPFIDGHKLKVLELEWYPFNDNLLASASEDTTVKIWQIPDGGLKQTLSEPYASLEGHQKRVHIIEWHPTAELIIASGSIDHMVKIWNVSAQTAIYELQHPNIPTFMSWNHDGSLLATTCKDAHIRLWDPRKEVVVREATDGFNGNKHSKCKFLANGMIFVAGFVKNARKCGLWDSVTMQSKACLDIDSDSGSMQIHDAGNNVIFLCAKGEQSIRFYEVTDEPPYLYGLASSSASSSSERGAAFMPNRGLDPTKSEIARWFKLGGDTKADKCEIISMTVPRKSTLYQEDIYTPCWAGEASMKTEQWIEGHNAPPKTIEMKQIYDKMKSGKAAVSTTTVKHLAPLTRKAAPAVSAGAPAENGVIPPNVDIAKLVADVKKLKGAMRKVTDRVSALEKQLGEVVADDHEEEE